MSHRPGAEVSTSDAREGESPPLRMWTMEAIAEARTRPARKQHDPETGPRQEHAYDSDNYNVWYGKSARGRERGRPPQKIAATRCDAVLDSGRTRGDAARQTTHCLHFARGCCVSGPDCPFLHRLPTAVDDARASPMHDCFGREKHPDEREDNGGVGSYIRNVRTLFVYYGGAGEWSRDRVIALLERQFSEWGPVEDVYAVPVKCVGFVRFAFRSSAEFAKEAMMGQRLTKTMTEPLTVRWANDDPNPTAVRRVKREREETAADAIVRAEARAPPEQRAAMAHLRFLANARRGRAETNGDDDGDGDEAPNPLAYPDTDAQYPDEGEGGVVADARRVATDAVDGADARARRGASVEENAAASPGGAGDGAVGQTPDAGAETAAPPPAPFAASVSAEELARINAAIGFAARAPGDVDDAAEDDEHEFDPDDYPTFEVEEVGDARS